MKITPTRQVVLDIETTGLDPASGDRIIEIAAVEMLDYCVSGKHLHRFINPEREIDEFAEAIHGVSLEMLLDKPKFSEVATEVTEFIRGAELILHNAPFDVEFLNKELSLVGLNPIEELCPSIVATLAMARTQRPKQKNSISALCTAYGINTKRKNLHGALLDAYLLADVYLALKRATLAQELSADSPEGGYVMKSYLSTLQAHLATYKRNRLGIVEDGTFKGKPYPHILPAELRFLNFLEPVRAELQAHLKSNPGIKLHQYFHHLNSSQAFAFNFFYPFLAAGGQTARAFSTVLGVDADAVQWAFEVVPDAIENTNVDVAWQTAGGATVFCEVKLSEADFGRAKNDERHRDKLAKIYRPRLEGHISDALLAEEAFFGHYQLLRNVSLMAGSEKDRLVLLMPRANESLSPQLKTVLAGTQPNVRSRIHVAYIEDCLSALMTSQSVTPELSSYVSSLWEKYVPSIDGQALV